MSAPDSASISDTTAHAVVVQCPCSAWADSGKVMAEADTLEELIQLKLENPGMTRERALKWALEMREIYKPNDLAHTQKGRERGPDDTQD